MPQTRSQHTCTKVGRMGQTFRRQNWDRRLRRTYSIPTQLLTRQEMQSECPDLLITNYSMLEYMLLRPIERSIFNATQNWLASDPSTLFTLVLDEAHTYRGARRSRDCSSDTGDFGLVLAYHATGSDALNKCKSWRTNG